jgi:LysM repeat protein
MSKDVIIAGIIVAACLGLVAVAFVMPKNHKKPVMPSDTAALTTDTPGGTPSFVPTNDLPLDNPGNPSPGPNTYNFNPGPTNNPIGPNNFNPNPNPNPNNNNVNPSPFPLPVAPPVGHDNVVPVAVPTEAKTHTVDPGETLGEISQKYYGTAKHWRKIAEANKVDAESLQVGQKLTIPVIESAAVAPGPTESTPGPGERTYKLKAGDSYYTIAKRELGNASRWRELEKLNGIGAEDLRVGQTIKLPAKEMATVPTVPTGPVGDTGPTSGRVHVVAAGDTLGEISRKYFGTTAKWKEIVKANPGVDPENLKVGQKLNLPESAGTSAPTAVVETGDYVVKPGDTLGSIAQSQLGKKSEWKRLVEANPGLDAKRMRIGQKLKIPGKAKTAEPAPATGNFGGLPATGVGSGLGPSVNPAPTFPAGYPFHTTTPTPSSSASGGFPGGSPAPAPTNPGSGFPSPTP